MSKIERAWRAWIGLGERDRERFLQRLRQTYAEERAARRAANGTGTAYRGPSSLASLSLSESDLAPPQGN